MIFQGWKDVTMSCELAHEQIVMAAYGELSGEQVEELERHMAVCPGCAAELEQ
jgi:anti-sigma factor RsiW